MALFWLCYRQSGQVSVAIIEAPSLIHARMRAALDGTDAETTFAEGHELDAGHATRVPRNRITKLRRCWTGLDAATGDRAAPAKGGEPPRRCGP
jgi:hypothetical protein